MAKSKAKAQPQTRTQTQTQFMMGTTRRHIALSVDIDRHSDRYLQKEYLQLFRDNLGPETTVADIRKHCEAARAEGLKVFPACDHVDAWGYCKGHPLGGPAEVM